MPKRTLNARWDWIAKQVRAGVPYRNIAEAHLQAFGVEVSTVNMRQRAKRNGWKVSDNERLGIVTLDNELQRGRREKEKSPAQQTILPPGCLDNRLIMSQPSADLSTLDALDASNSENVGSNGGTLASNGGELQTSQSSRLRELGMRTRADVAILAVRSRHELACEQLHIQASDALRVIAGRIGKDPDKLTIPEIRDLATALEKASNVRLKALEAERRLWGLDRDAENRESSNVTQIAIVMPHERAN